jgi:FtsP/CotA-like multicopper oxidase with cupredoxin domain
MLSRRSFLTATGAAAVSALPRFSVALADDGFVEIIAGPSRHKLYEDDAADSDLWTYGGTTPGPEIRVRKGERARVRLINALEEPTTIHWHGIRIDNAMDGVPDLTQSAVEPGQSFEYDFVAPDSGTYWYHAHNKSWDQVARGLYGPLIVEEAAPAFDRDHDLTLVLDDWRLAQDGSLDLDSLGAMMDWSHAGRLGNWLTVNGESRPSYEMKAGEAYRLRLINAANARVLVIDPSAFGASVIALDGQTLVEPDPGRAGPLAIAPAQRVDLLVRPASSFEVEEISTGEPFGFLSFDVTGDTGAVEDAPIAAMNTLSEPDMAKARSVALHMTGGAMGGMGGMMHRGRPLDRETMMQTGQVWAFNGVANLSEEPLFNAVRGETIIVEAVNDTAFAHGIHLHGHHFRVLDGMDAGRWRDTFLVAPDERVRIAFVADNPGKWLLHCHMLEHAAAGMNTWFAVA